MAQALVAAESFWERVARGRPDECWPWTAFCNPGGYGMLRWPGYRSMQLAHRVAWLLTNGQADWALHVLHRCDNPPCCNPAHLFLGTNADNVADKVAKGRSSFPQPKKRCERHPLAKLTDENVRAIRARLADGETGRSLASEYGVSRATISQIKNGKSWATLS